LVNVKGAVSHRGMKACAHLLRSWVRSWINQLSLWCTASMTPDLQLPSQM